MATVSAPSRNSGNSTSEPLQVKIPKQISQQVRNALTGKLRAPKTKERFTFEHGSSLIAVEVARNCQRTCTFTAISDCGCKATKTITARRGRVLKYPEIHEGLRRELTRPIVLRPEATG